MKKKSLILILFFYFLKSNGQTPILGKDFTFENTKIEYFISTGKDSRKFYVVIKDTSTAQINLLKDIKKCLKKKKPLRYNYYYLAIPKELFDKKEELIFALFKNIFLLQGEKHSKTEMNILSDGDYFQSYIEKQKKAIELRRNLLIEYRNILKDSSKSPKDKNLLKEQVSKSFYEKWKRYIDDDYPSGLSLLTINKITIIKGINNICKCL